LNIVIDGLQSAAAACPNRMDPPASHIPLNQMEKVEIHKGPHALRYGPSFGGVINFISQQPAFGEGRKTVGRLSTAYENNGSLFRMEGILGSEREKMALYFKGMWSQGNDYLDGSGMEVPAHFKRGSVGINGIYRLTDVQQVDFSITRNFARNVDFAGLAMDLVSDDSWMARVGHTIHYNKRINTWSTAGFVSLVDHFMDNMSKTLNPRMANAETPATTRTYGGRSEINLKLNKSWAYIGGDVKIDEASGYRTREFLMGPSAGITVVDNAWQDARIGRAGIFTEYHVNPEPYHFIVSARFDLNHAAIRHAATEYTTIHGKSPIIQLNPSVSLGITREVAQDIDIGLWLGRGQRSGSITERFINFFTVGLDPYELVGNPALRPESNNQVDLNLSINKERYRISYNLFSSWLQEFITSEIRPDLSPRLPSSPGVRMFANIKNARLSGFEASWVQTWPLNFQHQVDVAYVYGKNILKSEPLPEIPPLDFRLRLSRKFFKNKLKPEISLRQVLGQNRISPSFGETTTGSFTLIGIKASYYFDQYFKISGGVHNIFDKAYHEHLNRRFSGTDRNILDPGRNIFLVLSFDLGN
jgi:iron complex outermembrane recepter protein